MQQWTRRDVLRLGGAGAALLLAGSPLLRAQDKKEPFSLPKLPYAYDALEPYIDARTMQIHHNAHHGAYVKNLNAALEKHPELAGKSLEELLKGLDGLPKDIQTAVRNNGGGHANHTMFWQQLSKDGGQPSGALAKAIDEAFGSLDKFQAAFSDAAMKRFGSGWAWLIAGKDKLEVVSTPNQDTPLMEGKKPILGLDVWEHAYYLKYQNKRADYVKAWWNVVNWKDVAERHAAK